MRTTGLTNVDRELLSFALELASFGPFLADELFVAMREPLEEGECEFWLESATRRRLIVEVASDPAVARQYTVDRHRCERRLRGLARAR